jgi:hypothetical protein
MLPSPRLPEAAAAAMPEAAAAAMPEAAAAMVLDAGYEGEFIRRCIRWEKEKWFG